jgi:hypothetical protein
MRNLILEATIKHAQGHIAKHIANIEIYLNKSVGIGEHSDIISSIEQELEHIDKYQSQLDIIDNYFLNSSTNPLNNINKNLLKG